MNPGSNLGGAQREKGCRNQDVGDTIGVWGGESVDANEQVEKLKSAHPDLGVSVLRIFVDEDNIMPQNSTTRTY